MFPTTTTTTHSTKPRGFDNLEAVRSHMAQAMVGRTVDLATGAHSVRHGIVTGVFSEAGRPKIVVAGHRYDVSQVLTIQPVSVNSQS